MLQILACSGLMRPLVEDREADEWRGTSFAKTVHALRGFLVDNEDVAQAIMQAEQAQYAYYAITGRVLP